MVWAPIVPVVLPLIFRLVSSLLAGRQSHLRRLSAEGCFAMGFALLIVQTMMAFVEANPVYFDEMMRLELASQFVVSGFMSAFVGVMVRYLYLSCVTGCGGKTNPEWRRLAFQTQLATLVVLFLVSASGLTALKGINSDRARLEAELTEQKELLEGSWDLTKHLTR